MCFQWHRQEHLMRWKYQHVLKWRLDFPQIPSTESWRCRKAEIPSHIKAAGSYLTETSVSAVGCIFFRRQKCALTKNQSLFFIQFQCTVYSEKLFVSPDGQDLCKDVHIPVSKAVSNPPNGIGDWLAIKRNGAKPSPGSPLPPPPAARPPASWADDEVLHVRFPS